MILEREVLSFVFLEVLEEEVLIKSPLRLQLRVGSS
jgi:hypothetical protein